jgi:uncharacterized protein
MIKKIGIIFWNPQEKRLRAFWRLSIHTVVLLVFTSIMTFGLLLLVSLFGSIGLLDLGEFSTGINTFELMEISWLELVIVPLATCLAVFLATYVTGRLVDRRMISDFGIQITREWLVDFTFGFCLGAGLMSGIFITGLLTGYISVTGYFESFQAETGFTAGILQALFLFIMVGIYEEVLSRGYHLVNFAEGLNHKKIGKKAALILAFAFSSMVFGILHLGNPNATWISTINLTLAGMFLGLGMVLTGSLAIPIGLHIAWNFFQGNVFGFPVSGMQTAATFIATETTESGAWLMGGSFGPEAGLIGLAAIFFGSLLTLLLIRRKQVLKLNLTLVEYQPKGEFTTDEFADNDFSKAEVENQE